MKISIVCLYELECSNKYLGDIITNHLLISEYLKRFLLLSCDDGIKHSML